ncbi:hypothetical protein ACFPOD_04860 [Nitratireductor kimnyeongensis]|uniref:Phage tail protein n=1 Tax=Nitratireductor kimnyeongensis TaxID=430679 RepID=A0ABW0T4X9_9HYPH|nr:MULTISPECIES: hypothetical protein [Nitratireductor]MCC5777846.1 hypothetical protein [Nitratireductor sp. B36]QZZ34585.1 hypothetical protein KW403_12335 [Nitratireductor kimnyeongensis]
MTAFPFTHPHIRFTHSRFRLQRVVASSPSGAGRINFTETADPTWTIQFTSVPLRESELAEIAAWWSQFRGGLKSTLVTQNVTCRPFAHSNPAQAAPAQDAGVLDGVSGGNVLAVSGVSPSLVLQPGDLLGLERLTFRGLHRVIAVSGSGTSRSITVEPPPRSYVAQAGAVVRFEQPELNMRSPVDSWSVSEGARPVVSFSFVESRV